MTLDLSGGVADVLESLEKSYLWIRLGWFDIRQRFRRSVLGPLWITLTMAALVAGMGPLYAAIFDLELRSYVPYLTIGVILWGFISATATESCNAFINGAGVIRQTRLPLSSFILRAVWRNVIVLGFNGVLVFVVVIYAGTPTVSSLMWAVVGLGLLVLAAVGGGMLIGIFCTRYRDMHQVVVSVLQLLMFLTPVFWRADQLPQRSRIVDWNPAFYYLEAIRGPLLGVDVGIHVYVVAALIACGLWLIGLVMFARYRRRIVYWL